MEFSDGYPMNSASMKKFELYNIVYLLELIIESIKISHKILRFRIDLKLTSL